MTSLQVRFKTTPSPEHSTQPCSARIRSRKSHKKSRFGCLHCKERRIKCDEGRPSCSACRRRNVTCSLADAYQTPLAISSGGKAQLLPQESSVIAMPVSFNVLAAALINNSLRREERFPRAFEVDDLKMLQHFKQFTSTTIGNTETQIAYRDVVPRLAAEVSYLILLPFNAANLAVFVSYGRTSGHVHTTHRTNVPNRPINPTTSHLSLAAMPLRVHQARRPCYTRRPRRCNANNFHPDQRYCLRNAGHHLQRECLAAHHLS